MSSGSNEWEQNSDIALAGAAQGDILFYDGTSWVVLVAGAAGEHLETNGAGSNPSWEAGGGGGSTIYSADGTLAANRIVDITGRFLLFKDTGTVSSFQIGGAAQHPERLAVVGSTLNSSSISAYRFSNLVTGPDIFAAHARGTEAAPTALTSGNEMGRFSFIGHDGAFFSRGAHMRGFTTETWAVGRHGCELRWYTTANGDNDPTERMRLREDGRLEVDQTVLEGGNSFSSNTTTAALGFLSTYAHTGTGTPHTLTISTADIAKGSVQHPWSFVVSDQGGGAGTDAVTIATEGAETIDGAATFVIDSDFGSVRIYSNGSNLFTEAISAGDDVVIQSDVSVGAGSLAVYDGTTGTAIEGGGPVADDVVVQSDVSVGAGSVAVYDGFGGTSIEGGGPIADDIITGGAAVLIGQLPQYSATDGKTIEDSDFATFNKAMCVRLINKSGALSVVGDIYSIDLANDNAAVLTTGTADERFCGVCQEAVADGTDMYLAVLGLVAVNCAGAAISRGDFIDPSPTAGLAHPHAGTTSTVFGIATTDKGAGVGTCNVWLNGAERF